MSRLYHWWIDFRCRFFRLHELARKVKAMEDGWATSGSSGSADEYIRLRDRQHKIGWVLWINMAPYKLVHWAWMGMVCRLRRMTENADGYIFQRNRAALIKGK